MPLTARLTAAFAVLTLAGLMGMPAVRPAPALGQQRVVPTQAQFLLS